MHFAIVGKPTAKVKRDGVRVRVKKRAHIIGDGGMSLCKTENGYARPMHTKVNAPREDEVCQLCLQIAHKRGELRNFFDQVFAEDSLAGGIIKAYSA